MRAVFISAFLIANLNNGGETDSTGTYKLGLRAEFCTLVKQTDINIIADDYAHAVAA